MLEVLLVFFLSGMGLIESILSKKLQSHASADPDIRIWVFLGSLSLSRILN